MLQLSTHPVLRTILPHLRGEQICLVRRENDGVVARDLIQLGQHRTAEIEQVDQSEYDHLLIAERQEEFSELFLRESGFFRPPGAELLLHHSKVLEAVTSLADNFLFGEGFQVQAESFRHFVYAHVAHVLFILLAIVVALLKEPVYFIICRPFRGFIRFPRLLGFFDLIKLRLNLKLFRGQESRTHIIIFLKMGSAPRTIHGARDHFELFTSRSLIISEWIHLATESKLFEVIETNLFRKSIQLFRDRHATQRRILPRGG
mmetsp:Transcript_20190/g.36807  ORF Transcript_20190/g.36807 Transcript_20190/m.36807 type:complete len:260 (+) Transcript_20190:336-1115(+)